MKTQSSRRTSGFTLVELLVVIAIIAVLAGAGFAAGNAAIQKARRTTALSTVIGIESAVSNFYTEYGSLPADPVPTTALNTKNSGIPLLKVLLGMTEAGATPLNSRAIKFLSVKEGKANRNGLIYNAAGTDVSGLYDPWGGGFFVIMDDDYDEVVTPTPSAGGTTVNLNGRRVAAWSNGADAVSGTGGKATDDVKNW
jgi:prepilin-type N-terminal cleavage/methylation domain-containing protein